MMYQYIINDKTMQYMYDEYTLLEAVIERDIEAVQAILDDNPTEEELNERDKSGRVRDHLVKYNNEELV